MTKWKKKIKTANQRSEQNHIEELFKKYNLKWVALVSFWTFFLAAGFHYLSEQILIQATIVPAFIILILIIFLGVFFDMIGIAVAVASEKPFHAMAADKVPSARKAIQLLKNAGMVSNICNDVVGDICGIVSGVASATILLKISPELSSTQQIFVTLILGGFVASLTVGGKAIGKNIALENSHQLVHAVSKVMHIP
ncbi:hypothetical protein [Tindallia californiensis]|uniref:Uncharacterized protein n=1 Tax=Tindallia californiensis TaxID=159292 RepID=A0A1H3NM16_9FIRM|nr:hypothetical protein [Tindallia californiensis]SDY89249.1 hypothetical protein SAMN05192546_105162 [Tindallia californiensis]